MSLYLSDILSQCVSVSLITSFCITLSRPLSLPLSLHYGHSLCLFFPPFSPHTIPLLFSIQVRSFTGSPFSDELGEDNHQDEKLIHLIFIYIVVTWHRVHASLLWDFSHSFSFFFINRFIASLLPLMPLPHSLPIYLSQNTTVSIYLYLLLHLTFTLRIAIIMLLVLHISLSHLLSVSLTQPLTIVYFIFATLFLSFFHSCYDIIIMIIVFVLIIIISLLVLSLANTKIDILEKIDWSPSFFSISDELLPFSLFFQFIYFWISSKYLFLINYCFLFFSLLVSSFCLKL